jgi:hypothetical protein
MRMVVMKKRAKSTETKMIQRAAALKLARGESTTAAEDALAMDFLRACGATTVRGSGR